MFHAFDVDIAAEYGVKEAILIQFFYFWHTVNEANGNNFRDGRYWSYNSVKAFEKLFPYMTKDQIRRTLERLVDKGLIIKGTFNTNTYDRTSWYALSDLALSKVQKCQMDLAKMPNGFAENAKCNTYSINTIVSNNTDNKTTNEKQDNDSIKDTIRPTLNVEHIISEWNSLEKLGIKPVMKLGDGTKRKQSLMARLKSYTEDDFMKAIDNIRHSKFLQGGSRKGWVITFDWFVLPNNFPKVLEGNYNDPGTKPIDYSKHYYQKPEYVPQTEEEKRRSQEYWDSLEDEDDV